MTLDLERKLADIDRQLMANIDRVDKIDRIPDNSSIFHAAMLAVVSIAGGTAFMAGVLLAAYAGKTC